MSNYNSLYARLGYTFTDENLLTVALTHSSYANEMDTISYERLEFLGDAVIELVISDYIYNNLPLDAGLSTKLRASLVSTTHLSEISISLGLDKIVLKSRALSVLGRKNIADLLESVVGAIYIDGGLDNAKQFIDKFIIIDEDNIQNIIKTSVDYKTKFQEYMQSKGMKFEYVLKDSYGLAHDKTFEVELYVEGEIETSAVAKSIQQAEEKCAELYFNNLD